MTEQWKSFATVDPFDGMTAADPGTLQNLASGEWHDVSARREDIVDPMNGDRFLHIPDTEDLTPFAAGLKSCPKTGLLARNVRMSRVVIFMASSTDRMNSSEGKERCASAS